MPTRMAASGSGVLQGRGRFIGDPPPLMTNDPRIVRALEFIDQHLDRPIHLAELAAVAAVERKHLSRLFKRATGWHCTTLIRRLRLTRAEELLRHRRSTIAAVAAQVGWDVRTLQRVFREHAGVTAQAYRTQAHRNARVRGPLLPAVDA